MTDTEGKILETAERLFGEQGYAATSLRHIISEAGVNLAAIHYHFGSKEDLLDQLIVRKAAPVNAERLARLDCVERDAASDGPKVDDVLEAFLAPPLRAVQHSPNFVKLMGRMYGEGLMPMIAEKHFHEVAVRFLAALQRALPHLTVDQVKMRVQFLVGAMAHSMFALPVPKMACPQTMLDAEELTRELVAFLSGGMRAPAAVPNTTKEIGK